jgi:hypothetical protein
MQKKRGSLPSSSCFALSLLAFVSAFSLLHFYFMHFLLVSSFSQAKKKQRKKKNPYRRKKMQIREGAYFQAFALPSHFWLLLLPFRFKCFLLTSSSFQTKEKKNTMKKKP